MHVDVCGTEVAIEWRTLQHVYSCAFLPPNAVCACVLVHERKHILMHFCQTVWVYFILFES